MEYERKYKEAQGWIEKIYPTLQHEQQMEAEVFFPELKESKDERVRKAILELVKQSSEVLDKQNQNNMINWLEKQGKKKPFNKDEPKFHEGEWITNGDYTWKIVEVKPLDYILQSQDGNIVDDTIAHVDEQFHSFTIEDAKDGDVLVASDESVFIYSGSTNTYAQFYIALTKYGDFNTKGGNWEDKNCVKPATKSQRDTLFAKMKEAGYEWDAEKKELKQIKQDKNMELTDFESALFTAFSDAWQQYLGGEEVNVAQWTKEHSAKLLEEAMKEALRTEYEKGRSDVLRCIDPDVMVADFCSQPLSKTRSIASVYRQAIIDIIKRINNNEETSINSTRSIDDGGV